MKSSRLHTLLNCPCSRNVLAALRPAVVALIFAAGINMLLQVVFGSRADLSLDSLRWASALLFSCAFFVLCKFRPNPIAVMAACGAAGLLLCLAGWM